MNPTTPELIRQRLMPLAPLRLEIEDDSARHAGHAGAREGGHYNLFIVAAAFAGKSTMARHRLVYDTLGDLGRTGIHALSIRAKAPDEV